LIEETKNQRALQRIEKDSESLLVLQDSRSFLTTITDNLSKLSWKFDFDDDLLITRIYKRAFRGSLRSSLRIWQRDQVGQPQLDIQNTNSNVQKMLIREIDRDTHMAKALLLGLSLSID
jgi:hypothetical protein